MAPNLKPEQHDTIHELICKGTLTNRQIASEVGCSVRSIEAARSRLRAFGETRAPRPKPGPKPLLSSSVHDILQNHLTDECDLYLEEMQYRLEDEFGISASERSIRRSLAGWSKKVIRRRAEAQSPELRDYYMHKLSAFQSYQLVYIDESGSNQGVGQRKKGWSPRGITPKQVGPLQRGKKYQVLPAYTQDGILFAQVFEGTTTGAVFEDFIRELLPMCSPWPGRRSVLIMDNASIHHSAGVKQMCLDARVKLLFLPPYSPDLNPIEEFFAELKSFAKTNWRIFREHPQQGFATFLMGCIDVVGKRTNSARGHFRHAGVSIEGM